MEVTLSSEDRHEDVYPEMRKAARLELEDGAVFEGFSFGDDTGVAGEVVFNTGMVGYPESLTDPSYTGQLLVLTSPMVGNYGVPEAVDDEIGLPKFFEGARIYAQGLVVADHCGKDASHFRSRKTLGEWLKEFKVPGIYGVDTRAITKHIREKGSLLGKIVVDGKPAPADDDPNARNLAAEVSTKQVRVFEPVLGCPAPGEPNAPEHGLGRAPHIVLVDCGIKYNIIRFFVKQLHCKVTLVPWDHDFVDMECDGYFISNGPGNPETVSKTVDNVRRALQRRPAKPLFGICLGHQILSLAAGASTYKMKFGNRGMNQPCVDLRTTRCFITPQNHGYAVDVDTLPSDWTPLFMNANDGSNEGIIHRHLPFFSVQFHPEACGGPTDTSFLFNEFLRLVASPSNSPVTTVPYHLPVTYRKVLVLGSGGLSIGQGGEFDYSGSQSIKALKEANIQSVLINPNIATVQTSSGLADRVYFLPVTPEFVERVIQKERPDGLFCTFGGQTALNCAVELSRSGVLDKYDVQVLGTPISAIEKTEDREIFAQQVESLGFHVAESAACSTLEDSIVIARKIGYPVLVRAAFTLGGLGSGFANDEAQLAELVKTSLAVSPQVMIDKSLKGWKELEYEVVRDAENNCITVCNMENLDPMGIHTGDSIVIAPSQTLTNEEHFRLRACALEVIRHFGIKGECNIQYAVDPNSDDFRIIEVNARLSRSSALASKATGYPLAYVAAKIALGHSLVQLRNSVTKTTTACFEPALDYCVMKMPRWDLKKFGTVNQELGSAMKSVGEVMAIGRTFEETFQKALRMVDDHGHGFDAERYDMEWEFTNHVSKQHEQEVILHDVEVATPIRMWALAKALDMGRTVDELHDLSKIDKWFLNKMAKINRMSKRLSTTSYYELEANRMLLLTAKQLGFADSQIASRLKATSADSQRTGRTPLHSVASSYSGGVVSVADIRSMRVKAAVRPVVKQIDTMAAEFPAQTNYLYLTYHGTEHDVEPCGATVQQRRRGHSSHMFSPMPSPPTLARVGLGGLQQQLAPLDLGNGGPAACCGSPGMPTGPTAVVGGDQTRVVLVLGCGCYRIGSSVEFDWCCVSCIRTLRAHNRKAIVINCNPETVSTDYDESDRLFFEELSLETVLEINAFEEADGCVISVGGQAPQNLAVTLSRCGVKILGTQVEAIDAAENRFKFSQLCDALNIDQPEWSQFLTLEEARSFSLRVKFPVLVRPSYVLSGAAMRVVYNVEQLHRFLKTAAVVSRDFPVVISKYIEGAKEVEFDAVGCDGTVVNYAISEHVENAGVHSGDASLILPAQKMYVETHRRVIEASQKLCRTLKISGPFNVQFMCKDNKVKVIECNLRASRTFPFISKTFNINFIELATKVFIGLPVHPHKIHPIDFKFVGAKVPVFSFSRLKNADPRLGVEMQSTGEVACFGVSVQEAFLKAMISAGFKLPTRNILLSVGPHPAKLDLLVNMKQLVALGYALFATKHTHAFLKEHGMESVQLRTPGARGEPNILTYLGQGKLDLVLNIPDSAESMAETEGFAIRRSAVDFGVPLITDIKVAHMLVDALVQKAEREKEGKEFWSIESWQTYANFEDTS